MGSGLFIANLVWPGSGDWRADLVDPSMGLENSAICGLGMYSALGLKRSVRDVMLSCSISGDGKLG